MELRDSIGWTDCSGVFTSKNILVKLEKGLISFFLESGAIYRSNFMDRLTQKSFLLFELEIIKKFELRYISVIILRYMLVYLIEIYVSSKQYYCFGNNIIVLKIILLFWE